MTRQDIDLGALRYFHLADGAIDDLPLATGLHQGAEH